MPDQHKKPQAPFKFRFTKQEFKTAIRVFKELTTYYEENLAQFGVFSESAEEDDPVGPDFTITSEGDPGENDRFTLSRSSITEEEALFCVNPGDEVAFLNDTDTSIRLTFFTDSNCQEANAATNRFDLGIWNNKPCLDIGPGQTGFAPTSTHSEHTPNIYTGIWIKIYEKPDAVWSSGRSGGGGPDMGINNP